jgi:uncharacterized protein
VGAENIELMRRGYAAWNAGDIDAVVATLDPQVEWHGHPQLPEPGPFKGREAVRRWLDNVNEALESISVKPLAFAESANSVVVLVHITGRGRGSGVEVESGIDAHIWKIVDGAVIRFQWLQGDKAAERAELSPQHAEVMRLRGELQMSDSAIGERLGMSESQVASAAEEALARLPLLAGADAR